jgi:NAD(P)-dependent dehydrogenase (short-subunit alcohol dehydrogenase family)
MTGEPRQRIAVVTGAARGLGRAHAERLAGDGIGIVLADLEEAGEAREAIVAAGGRAFDLQCDVSDPDSVAGLADDVAGLGGADILVHNAGIYPMRSFEDITFEEWKKVMGVNLDSIFLLTRAFLPNMRERGWGRIVGVSTAMFHAGNPGTLHYVTSKAGIIGFVRSLAPEVGTDGITVNAIAPGLIQTEGTSVDAFGDLFGYAVGVQCVKRPGVTADLTGAVSFLVSDDASFMTGQTLLVDGGMARS